MLQKDEDYATFLIRYLVKKREKCFFPLSEVETLFTKI